MKLVLAEKPSVAQSLAKVLGATVRNDGFLEGSGYIVSWCFGHLIELSEPEAYDPKYGKWSREDLPILPRHWQYQVSPSTQKQYFILHDLLHREDVESVINACDAGREGELIFRLVYEQSRCTKPIERLWISSMEDSAIQEGFANLKPGAEYDRLYQAALCRERADWLVGINGTRLFSCLYRKTLNVGRVMTPTLAMVVLRDAQINSFQSEPFHTLQFDVGGMPVSSDRFKDKREAESVQEQCVNDGWIKVISVKRQEKTEHPPLLYDLTSLQRDANRILGYTAQQTLDYAQSLYEKKLITYPRTDSHYLTADMESAIPDLGDIVNCSYPHCHEGDYLTGKVINSQKVTDHHAIIPTKEVATAASTMIANGIDIVTTANELGHANATTTANIYAHQIAMAKAKAAEVRGGVFSDRDKKTRRRRAR